jgi:hypothetical protein
LSEFLYNRPLVYIIENCCGVVGWEGEICDKNLRKMRGREGCVDSSRIDVYWPDLQQLVLFSFFLDKLGVFQIRGILNARFV